MHKTGYRPYVYIFMKCNIHMLSYTTYNKETFYAISSLYTISLNRGFGIQRNIMNLYVFLILAYEFHSLDFIYWEPDSSHGVSWVPDSSHGVAWDRILPMVQVYIYLIDLLRKYDQNR